MRTYFLYTILINVGGCVFYDVNFDSHKNMVIFRMMARLFLAAKIKYDTSASHDWLSIR